jgi:A/G-specific adenine glycosylase
MSDIPARVADWHEREGRRMAWRDTRDPYRVWIAEVIFQQTRIAQGEAYLHRFLARFPDLPSLAAASTDEVLKHWEGLGYYSRARNLHRAARQLAEAGRWPETHLGWLALPGVGPYTARAVASFAFGEGVGVLDGNVIRVMSRLLGEFAPVDLPAVRKAFQQQADAWAAQTDSRAFNQGMMDLGAVVCTPSSPACLLCPLESRCEARKQGAVHLLPQKSPKKARKTRYFCFYLLRNEQGALLIRQRPPKGIWGGLWELPNEESPEALPARNCLRAGRFLLEGTHAFTHFDMSYRLCEPEDRSGLDAQGGYVLPSELSQYAFPKAILRMFEEMFSGGEGYRGTEV